MTRSKRSGDVIQYDQENPVPSSQTQFQGETKKEPNKRLLPPGNSLDIHLDERDPSSAKVIPDSMKETLREQVTYSNTASQRVASRFMEATMIPEIISNTSLQILEKGLEVPISRKSFNPDKGFWTFTAEGNKGESYVVRLKVNPKGRTKGIQKLPVQVSCTCPFFRWQGPEHWAKQNDYLWGDPVGTASKPAVKDPVGDHWICKHVAAAINMAQQYRLSSLDGPLEPLPDPVRVASRYMQGTLS